MKLDDVLEVCIEVLREHAGESPNHRAVIVAQWVVDSLGGEGQIFPFAPGLSARRARAMAVALIRNAEAEEPEEE